MGFVRRAFSLTRSQQRRYFSQIPSSNGESAKPLFPEELNIIYDSKCGICKLEMDFLARRDEKLYGLTSRKLRLTDIESEDYNPDDPSNGGVSYKKGMAAIHAVTADGRVIEGVPVFGRAYDLVGLGWYLRFMEWPVMKPVAAWGYEAFAKYRTYVTRGSSLEDLVKAHDEKKMDACKSCNSLKH
jgi:predicted DCC family thiol-disulfide oxidoreductase YuxK